MPEASRQGLHQCTEPIRITHGAHPFACVPELLMTICGIVPSRTLPLPPFLRQPGSRPPSMPLLTLMYTVCTLYTASPTHYYCSVNICCVLVNKHPHHAQES